VVKFLFVPLQYYVLKFGDDHLRGSGVVVGQISAFPIDFAGRSWSFLQHSHTTVWACDELQLPVHIK